MTKEEVKNKLEYYSSYFEAMFWADVENNDDLQKNDYLFTDINEVNLITQIKELDSFFEKADTILEDTEYTHDQACHDFYFTRCGHGVGFWENDHCNEKQGIQLTEIAKEFGTVYIGDDGNQLFVE